MHISPRANVFNDHEDQWNSTILPKFIFRDRSWYEEMLFVYEQDPT